MPDIAGRPNQITCRRQPIKICDKVLGGIYVTATAARHTLAVVQKGVQIRNTDVEELSLRKIDIACRVNPKSGNRRVRLEQADHVFTGFSNITYCENAVFGVSRISGAEIKNTVIGYIAGVQTVAQRLTEFTTDNRVVAKAVLVVKGIVAIPAIQRVVTFTAGQVVVAFIARHQVVTGAARHLVVIRAARQRVITNTRAHGVVTVTAMRFKFQRGVAGIQNIIARFEVNEAFVVISDITCRRHTDVDKVITITAIDQVATLATCQRVIASPPHRAYQSRSIRSEHHHLHRQR